MTDYDKFYRPMGEARRRLIDKIVKQMKVERAVELEAKLLRLRRKFGLTDGQQNDTKIS